MRDRLIERMKQGEKAFADKYTGKVMSHIEEVYDFIADSILADGWTRPPCKVGDVVYYIKHGSGEIVDCEVTQVRTIESKHKGKTTQIYFNSVDKSMPAFFTPIDFKYGFVCLTREEAVKALEGGGE